ncbi:MAG: hypothetical protein HN341_08405 [Verrucomicrobia bacterium]|nr:hypothetical protein [Verrucomicrobiota bacterium]
MSEQETDAIPKPIGSKPRRHDETVLLVFEDSPDPIEDPLNNAPSTGYYYMCGGVCWPGAIEGPSVLSSEGFFLVGGFNIETKRLYVFEETPFTTIDHVLDGANGIVRIGSMNWLNRCWRRYEADLYFDRCQDRALRSKHIRSAEDSVLRESLYTPRFYQLKVDDGLARQALFGLLDTGRLFYRQGQGLHKALQRAEAQPEARLPAVEALLACAAGLEQRPWQSVNLSASDRPSPYSILISHIR